MVKTIHFRDIRKNLGDVSIQRTTFADERAFPEHGHDYYEVFFVTESSIVHRINGRSVHMPVGSLWLIRPGDVHSLRKSEYAASAALINIAFDKAVYGALCAKAPAEMRDGVMLSAEEQQFLLHQIQSLRRRDMSDPETVRCVSWAIIMTALSVLLTRLHRPKATPPVWLEQCMAAVSQPERFIAGLPCFIALSGVSQEHLSREMRRYYDLTPSRYINQLRLEHACGMLKSTPHSVTTIALKCGFSSVSYFNRLFRRIYGCSPSDYRKLTDPTSPV